jgi:hypothetical protein
MQRIYTGTLALAATLLAARPAAANGRFPASTTVRVQPGQTDRLLLGTTFGVLLSQDGGQSFYWICEDAIGYGGNYDPDYAITPGGAIFATSYDGLRVTRDGGCTWDSAGGPLKGPWVAEVEVGPNGWIWAATADTTQANNVYVSKDEGKTFAPASAELARDSNTWWRSLRIAPGAPDRLYLSGYQVVEASAGQDAGPGNPDGGAGSSGPLFFLYRSDDGGQHWTPLDTSPFRSGGNELLVLGVAPQDPDLVFITLRGQGDVIYRSADKGGSWSQVLETSSLITSFLVRPGGQSADTATVIAGGGTSCQGDPQIQTGCVRISTDGGKTFTPPAPPGTEPQMRCLAERSDGALFACGANWDPDNFALGRSTDGLSWTKVTRFSEMAGPLACAAGTVQHDNCATLQWPSIAARFMVGPTTEPPPPAKKSGCGCNIGLALVIPPVLLWPRRGRDRRRRRSLSDRSRR